jgi:2-oxoglutarate dehydrogenase E1 component
LAQKFNTTKRFGLDGGEAIVPALKDAIDRASELGAHSFVLGMPHRGRLNVLANVMRKPMPLIFSEFQGTNYKVEDHIDSDDQWGMSGDVKCASIHIWFGVQRVAGMDQYFFITERI